MKSLVIYCLAIVVIASCAPALASTDLGPRVDSLCNLICEPEGPGCVVEIIEDGKIIFDRGYGLAELENNVPITEHTVLDIGSNAKQFTATCILLLEEQGKLDIDDELSKYVPEFPHYPWPITLRQLMQHTSGIRDYFDVMTLKGMNIGNNYPTEEYLNLIYGQSELNFRPGDQHLYSNSGYILLAEVIYRVSGMSLAQFAQDNIFTPLGMSATSYLDDPSRVVKNRAGNYGPLPSGEFWHGPSIAANIGDGGILTTVGDLALWDANFYNNMLGKRNPKLMRTLEQQTVLNSGDTIQWALGLRHDRHNGHHVIRHGGAYYGFRSEIARFPDEHLTVIVLANLMTIDATNLAYQIAELVIQPKPDSSDETTPPTILARLSAAELVEKAGTFKNPVTGTIWTVTAGDSTLSVATSSGYNFQLLPMDARHFRPSGIALPGTVAYSKLADGTKTIELVVPGQQTARFEPIIVASRPKNLGEYVGEFHCRDLGLTYVLSIENEILSFAEKGRSEWVAMSATITDEFLAQGGQTQIHFERDKDSRVRSMRLSLPRAKNFLFERVSS